MDKRVHIIQKLVMLSQRADFREPPKLPTGKCPSSTTHLAGMFLQTHYNMILEALRRMD